MCSTMSMSYFFKNCHLLPISVYMLLTWCFFYFLGCWGGHYLLNSLWAFRTNLSASRILIILTWFGFRKDCGGIWFVDNFPTCWKRKLKHRAIKLQIKSLPGQQCSCTSIYSYQDDNKNCKYSLLTYYLNQLRKEVHDKSN